MSKGLFQKRLNELERKWFDKTITPEEAKEYADWYNSDQDNPVEIPHDFATSDNNLETRMYKVIGEQSGLAKSQLGKISRFRIGWVAAACVFIFGLGTYIWLISGPNADSVRLAEQNPVNMGMPGGDRAVLQLGSGKTIVLDDKNNGELAVEGGSAIVKADGQLTYNTLKRSSSENVLQNTMTTPPGGQYRMVLADGTKVWLNASTSIKYPSRFIGKERVVELSGEAYFEVAKNTKQPFKVIADNLTINVLGTHFNVNAYNNESEIQTTLLEGNVIAGTQSSKVNLKPGEQAVLEKNGGSNVKLNPNVDIQQVIAWQKGVFEFRNANFSTIARQLSRWYSVEIIADNDLGKLKLGGGISKKLPLADVLELLKLNGANNKIENGKIKLYLNK